MVLKHLNVVLNNVNDHDKQQLKANERMVLEIYQLKNHHIKIKKLDLLPHKNEILLLPELLIFSNSKNRTLSNKLIASRHLSNAIVARRRASFCICKKAISCTPSDDNNVTTCRFNVKLHGLE